MQTDLTTVPRKRAPRRPRVERICEACGTTFLAWPSAVDQGRARWCSQPCFLAQRKRRLAVICEGCGAGIETIPSRQATGRGRFCSKACFDDAQAGNLADRFNRLVDHASPGACRPWLGNIDTRTGYGYLTVRNSKERAHIVAWEIATGQPVPSGAFVLHTCDYRRCVRNDDTGIYVVEDREFPRRGHLFLGDHAANMRDMVRKDRAAAGDRHPSRIDPSLRQGERNPISKLTDQDVRAIRARYADGGITQEALARAYGIDQTVVSKIVLRKAWAHVT